MARGKETKNEVADRILDKIIELLDNGGWEVVNSVIIKLTDGILNPKEYRFRIPRAGRDLFPDYYSEVELQTDDIGVIKRHYNPKYHELSIGEWLSVHPELKAGDKLVIEVIEPDKKYRLKILKE